MSRPTWTRMNTERSLPFPSRVSLPFFLPMLPLSCPANLSFPLPPAFTLDYSPIARCWYLLRYLCIYGCPVCTKYLFVYSYYSSCTTPQRPSITRFTPQTIASAVIYLIHLSMFYITTWRMNTNKASDIEGSTMDLTQ